MKFFRDYDTLPFITLKDLPGKNNREPFLNLGGVLSLGRDDLKLTVIAGKHGDDDAIARLTSWFEQTHKLRNIHAPRLTKHLNGNGVSIGIESVYDSVEIRYKIEDFILSYAPRYLNSPFTKRFHLPNLPLTGGKIFAEDETWVRLIVMTNDDLVFALEVNHEGHDYLLSHPHHLDWAKQLLTEFEIPILAIENDADISLAGVEDFEIIYAFLTLHATQSHYH